MRRSNFQDQPVDYAAVGATQAHDLMQYPPEGFVPYEASIRLGSGAERFEAASTSLLTWAVQRGAGLRVDDVQASSGESYGGIRYAEDGSPLEAIHVSTEQRFAADGTPYVTSGTTARLHGRIGSLTVDEQIRVVYLVEETNVVAFAYGTVGGKRVSGEDAFRIERREDDSVWFQVRSFKRPLALRYRILRPLMVRRHKRLATAYLRALSPLWTGPAS
ncbi:DUF1990 family protein [Mycetocola zhujimingii]|uniref:DUF1990 family protein n=1 Tax=Mycetocola zhujimingii TaxID=2079792 RepID=UPI000D375049|nr:DUF1990 family protein [Mycetocola zhujimingii]AWB86610.1 hypothetical protein C3E77_08250 [Mycetocola zhujimingii]